jgi:hypothetical protein
MRLQVRRKLERFERRIVRTINLGDSSTYVEKQMADKSIKIGAHATIAGPVVIADSIRDSFLAVESAKIDPDVKSLIRDLREQIEEAANSVPAEQASELVDNAAALAKEVSRSNPRREWYELSIAGLKDAAQTLGLIGKPIIETATKLLPILVKWWP